MVSLRQNLGNRYPVIADFLLNTKYMFKKKTSQFGEDALLNLIPGEIKYLEIGAWQPIAHSNSHGLKSRGVGVHIEPNPKMAIQWRIFRRKEIFLNIAVGDLRVPEYRRYFTFPRRFSVLNTFEESEMSKYASLGMKVNVCLIEVVPVTKMIDNAIATLGQIDLLMTDLEGMDLQILKGIHLDGKLDFKWILSEEDGESGVQRFLEGNGYLIVGSAGPSKLFKMSDG